MRLSGKKILRHGRERGIVRADRERMSSGRRDPAGSASIARARSADELARATPARRGSRVWKSQDPESVRRGVTPERAEGGLPRWFRMRRSTSPAY